MPGNCLIERLRLPADNIKMMPLNGTPLPECDIFLFESWVAKMELPTIE